MYETMGNLNGAIVILAVCLIVLAIGAMGRKVEWLVNFILRAVMGTVGIYAINYMLAARELQVAVGINPFTVLTSGILGFPGVAVLYGIHFFKRIRRWSYWTDLLSIFFASPAIAFCFGGS